MSRSFRATGARARQQALPVLLIAAAASVGTGLILTACSATAGSGGGAASSTGRFGTSIHAANGAAGVPAPLSAPRGTAGNGPDKAAGSSAGATAAKLALSTQSIIYTANMTVRVKDVTAAASQVTTTVTAVGGYVSGERQFFPQGKSGIPQVSLELKIPAAQFSQTLAKLSAPALGKRLSLSQHAQDVTQQVADVTSRVNSARAAITQLRALLKKAGSVGQLLSVQNEINSQESNLEALLAQQRALAHETSYGTATVLLVGHHARIVKKHKKTSHGFLAGLRGGWHALGVVVGWALTALGSALPFLIPAGLVGAIAFESRRRLARRKNAPASEPPPAASA
jgi:Domain of unknown function (DUF4349)